ncbi:sulfite exporter TauE/SafE family protein [Falsiroseomonas stagni]|uniref:Probable membrane transporter protein n=1 Tax=Falsiroseomonas stagni DSM 19981 TaxID=1123062 RepID=A0A1I4A9Q1_9PROT|nr:sulfite exporter TauE/SafE family protein [Falsiroseomonas stagni]SFK53105.1 hypothetical protein SAMN02745775_103257 [Falsiroseomonas stagni DSM 19981]
MTLPEGIPLAALVVASLASGIARGFSGFGAALVFMPMAAFAVGPRLAAPLLLVIDFLPMILLLRGAWPLADKAEVGWLSLGVLLGLPIGIAALALADPLALRWLVAGVILALLVLAASGLRFPATPHRGAAVGVGSVAGVLAGVALVPGPPVMAWLLGRHLPPAQLRAVFNLFLAASGFLTAAGFAIAGLFSAALLGPLLVAAPTYAAGTWIGTRLFTVMSPVVFRRACYAMIAASALLSLPLLDPYLR